MSTYRIQNFTSALDFGAYIAASPAAALDAMARDAGYPDHATACADSGDAGLDLVVTECLGGCAICDVDPVPPCQDATRYCAICDRDRAPDAAGNERDGEWICAACLATEPSDEPAS